MNPRIGTPWAKALGLGVAASLIVAIVVLAFTWPVKTASPHHLPVTVAGPEQAGTQVSTALQKQAGDTFEIHTAADRDAAVQDIRTRETEGAIVVDPKSGIEVLTATAAGTAPAQILNNVATQLGKAQPQAKVTVTNLVPLNEHDPNGAGLAIASLPLALGGVIGGILISLVVTGTWRRFAAAGIYAIAAGGILTAILQGWFGFLQSNALLNWLALGLTVLGTTSLIIGFETLLGRAGIPIGPVLTILVGNPLAGVQMPWQFTPEPWGLIGQYMVPGAGNTLIRSRSYFPDASTAQQWWVLIAWGALGIVLATIGGLRIRAQHHRHHGAHAAEPVEA